VNAADQTLSRRTLTIADLKPISRIKGVVVEAKRASMRVSELQQADQADDQKGIPAPATPPPPRQARSTANRPKAIQPVQARVTPVPTAPVPCIVERDADGFPVGWCFDDFSWGFHRSLWFEHGICLDVGEYAALIQQCRARTGERLQCNICQLRLRSGRTIIVAVRRSTPLTVLPDTGWKQYRDWAYALALFMPAPPLTPRRVGGRTAAQKAKDKRHRQNRLTRRRAERLTQVTG
jgi:hypothetical protein